MVIPTWNGRELLGRCLVRLREQAIPLQVIVADNGSTDGSAEWLRRHFPDVRVVELPENLGFGTAVNRGAEAGAGRSIVLLNNDVEADSGFVAGIVAPLEREEVGMVAGLLLRPGRAVVDSYGLELDRTLAAFPRFAGEPYRPELLGEDNLAAPSGGAAAYRRSAFEAAGGFDERLFAYMEDVDLGLRLRAAGWVAAGAANAIGVHHRGMSFGRRSSWQVETAGTSRGYMLRKYGVFGRGVGVAATALAAEVAAVGAETVLGRNLAALRGRVRGWRLAEKPTGTVPDGAVNPSIGLLGGLRRRRADL